VGIATQDETLRMRFNGKPEMVVAYFRSLAEEIRRHMAELGVRTLTELRGWYDRLETKSGLDALVVIPVSNSGRVMPQQTPEPESSGVEVEELFQQVQSRVAQPTAIHNFHRSIGSHLSGEHMRLRLRQADAPAAVHEFHGTAGQSFGAFLSAGLMLNLHGEANDYVGKGLSGGSIVIRAGHNASKRGDVLAGNTVLYGATSGQLFVAGQAGERFAVRNSGAITVVEGVGQHGCEYMTGGIAAILGPVGLNFGSGMTGGLAYILRSESENVLNQEFVQAHELEEQEEACLRALIEQHHQHTGSPRAARFLAQSSLRNFVRIQPLHLQESIEGVWRAFSSGVRDPVSIPAPGLLSVPAASASHYA